MENNIISKGTSELFNYGVLGIFTIACIIAIIVLGRYIKWLQSEHLKRTDKFVSVMESHAVKEAEQTLLIKNTNDLILLTLDKIKG